MDDLREELRKLKEEKLDNKLKLLQTHRDNAEHLANGKLYYLAILIILLTIFMRGSTGTENYRESYCVDSLLSKAHSLPYCCAVLLDPRISSRNEISFQFLRLKSVVVFDFKNLDS